jgi:3-hydroxyisobutyrate dehydrogenase-like beta-hydroxyacid dehydrogenase
MQTRADGLAADDATVGNAVGIIGLGLVGAALADLLLARGWPVLGCDIDAARREALAARGGGLAATPAAVAAHCSWVVLALMTTDIVLEVVEGDHGLLAGPRPPACIVDTTTGDPEATAALAARLATRNVAYLDATISGSSEQIQRRGSTFMVGGSAAAVAQCRDLLAVFSDRVYHLGPAGSGSRAKLASNLILGLNRLALAEGLVLAERLGLDLPAFLAVLKDSPAYSVAVDTKGPKMIAADFTPVARLRQHLKDVEMILACGHRAGQELPLSAVHRELLAQAVAAGDGDLDNCAIIRQLRRRRIGLAAAAGRVPAD